MAHYAFINDQNIVVEVITGKDEGTQGIDWEQHYAQYRSGMRCKRTSYNTVAGEHRGGGVPFRKNYAGIGYSYDETRDAFVPPQPYPSWILDENTCIWNAPVPHPVDGKLYAWDENTVNWVQVTG